MDLGSRPYRQRLGRPTEIRLAYRRAAPRQECNGLDVPRLLCLVNRWPRQQLQAFVDLHQRRSQTLDTLVRAFIEIKHRERTGREIFQLRQGSTTSTQSIRSS